MLATLVSALVTCIMNTPPEWTGCPLGGVMRIPMLVGTTREYLQFFFNSIFMCFYCCRKPVSFATPEKLMASLDCSIIHPPAFAGPGADPVFPWISWTVPALLLERYDWSRKLSLRFWRLDHSR